VTAHIERQGLSAQPPERILAISRPRLVDQLQAEGDSPVIVISAPAGSGKSVLVRQWGAVDERPHSVVLLQPWSDSPAALAEHLISALDPLGPSLAELRGFATGEEPRFSATLLPALAAAMSTRDSPYVLVLDDVHLLTDPRCHELLEQVTRAVPAGSQLALVGRNATPEWLARARTDGLLVEIGSTELAFCADETAEVLALHGVPAAPDLVDEVLVVTEGWPVGVYLVALLMSDAETSDDARERLFGPIGRGRVLRDYLRSQVLDPLDHRTREFLRATSLLDIVQPELCDAMLGRSDALATLRTLARSVQLVVPLDAADRVFRYHHLLQDVLRDELSERAPDQVPRLHVAAASWYAERGELDDAIRHAAASGDVPLAAALIAHNLGVAIGVGTPDRLEQWLRPFDDRVLGSDPLLAISRCWLAIQRGDEADIAVWLRRAEAMCPRWPERIGTVEAAGAVAVTALIVGAVPLAQVGRIATRIGQTLPPELPYVSTAHVVAFLVEDLIGTDRVERDRHASEALMLSTTYSMPSVTASTLSWQALACLLDGNPSQARPLQERAREIVVEARLERLATSGVTMSVDALYLAMSGRDEEAKEALGAARRQGLIMLGILPWFRTVGPLLHAATTAVLGDAVTARRLLADVPGLTTGELARSARVNQLIALVDTASGTAGVAGALRHAALTDAEMRVLQFLPSHLSLPQIAQRLFLSTNTVKTHVQSIYRKLAVSSRDEAVIAARGLGMLEIVPDLR
jgi:LuxR family maltose regulon positive regulatory protein